MGKKKKAPPLPEEHLHLPPHTSLSSEKSSATIIDTHTHLLSTFDLYKAKYPDGYKDYHEFVRGFYKPQRASDAPKHHEVETIIDVWCEAPVDRRWEEVANSAVDEQQRRDLWSGLEYWFVMGVHPHQARLYTDDVESEILSAMRHPRCIGLGEIGLDYHYMNSPSEVQKTVLHRQLKQAVALGKPLTIHTREADEDIERILKEEVPKDHRIHVHCFTDSPGLARRLLDYYPHLYIGVTGVITYSTNLNTAQVIRELVKGSSPASFDISVLRIVLETDAPYMVPANIYESLTSVKSTTRLPFSHSGMIPWTAGFVAEIVNAEIGTTLEANDVLEVSRQNARNVYGV
ncbi:hypothetical protein M408DRAFT_328132 [Serendipita vermifera MAFF 305830]|uniref:Amidohydrolase-related domain-containing protein n=1 Tax=Serendipita vermifera MAFF 305830 TaxID=933852 RepID=A0A0C2WWU8_SERVB|nr:hypothetical protein M408DRAFT_328132 [Serendipita vermifera MAFF 305830]